MSGERIGLACIGIAHPHSSVRLDVARRLEGYHLVGVGDRDPNCTDSVDALARYLNTQPMQIDDMLASEAVDAVIIESWTEQMASETLACLRAGKHVLVEKPAGLNTADLEPIVVDAEGRPLIVQVGYNFRFSPVIDFAERLLSEGTLGSVTQVRVHAAGPAGDAVHRWYNLPGDVGGTFWEDGCHIVDLLIHLFGMPNNATACISKFAAISDERSREDTAVAALEYDDKVVAFDFTGWEANDWIETWEFSLYGTEGTLQFRLVPAEYRLYLKQDRSEFRKGWNTWQETTFPVPWAGEPEAWDEWHVVENKSFFVRELQAFQAAIHGTVANPIPLSQAWNIASVMEACFQSSREKRGGVPVAQRRQP